jgi:hypothetical protein
MNLRRDSTQGGLRLGFCTKPHGYYCGRDLHTNKIGLYILKQAGNGVSHRNIKTGPELLPHYFF